MGQLMGAKEYDEIYKRCLRYLKYGIFASFAGAVMLFFYYRPILGIFTDDPDVLSTGRILFMIGMVLEPGRAFNIIIINGLRAAGDVKFPALMAIIFMWGVGALFAFLLGIVFNLGLPGILIAGMMDEWIRGIIMLFRWRSRVWENYGYDRNNDTDSLTEEVTA
jgi:Na+-driven multidrug efflux pump